MKISIVIDQTLRKDEVVIRRSEDSLVLRDIRSALQEGLSSSLPAYREGRLYFIPLKKVFRIFCEGSLVLAETDSGVYELKKRLYVWEEETESFGFIKVNSGELVNLNRVRCFDLTRTGVIRVLLLNGSSCRVSRRNMKKIKKYLQGEKK